MLLSSEPTGPTGDRSACPDAQAPLNQDVPPSAPMSNISTPSKDPVRRAAIVVLATIHVLGILGAPFAAKLHLFQPGATPHQNFHVVWEACKYGTASLLALAIVLGPLSRWE